MDIKKLLSGVDLESLPCDYCDVRIEDTATTSVQFRDFDIISAASSPSLGAFLRVFHRGQWSYCATTKLSDLTDQLTQMIKDVGEVNDRPMPDPFGPVKPVRSDTIRYQGVAPDGIEMADKLDLCRSYFDVLRSFSLLRAHDFFYSDKRKVKHFKSSLGSLYSFDTIKFGIRSSFTLRDGERIAQDRFQRYASSFDGLKGHQEQMRSRLRESERFLDAPVIEPGEYRIVMNSAVTGVFTHDESFWAQVGSRFHAR